MQNSTIIDIIGSLEKCELKELRLFLNSPYFNTNENVLKLYDFLTRKSNNNCNLSNKILHEHVFCGERFCNENIKTIIHLLTRLIEKFLVIRSVETEAAEYNRRLLRILDKKRLDKLFIKRLNQKLNADSYNTVTDLDTIYANAEFEKTVIEFYTKRNYEKEMFVHEQKFCELAIASFFVDMFKQYNIFWRVSYLESIEMHDYTATILDMLDLKELFKIFEDKKYTYKDLLFPYYNIYLILKEDTDGMRIDRIIESITGNKLISENEKFILSTILVNTLYYKNMRSGNQFTRELFEAFKLLLSLYKYSGEPHLRYPIFSNTLRIGLSLGEYKWTEEFINNSYVLLEPSVKENMYYYSNAYLSFAKKHFDKCLEYESKINHDTFQQKYYLRDLRLCSLYELGKFDSALSLVDSYRHFIKSDKSYTAKMKQRYLLFLGFIYDLIRIETGVSRKKPEDIRTKIVNALPMRKEWLIKKLDVLQAKQ